MGNGVGLWLKTIGQYSVRHAIYWHHIKCENIYPAEYVSLGDDDNPWICNTCTYFQFSDSFFECTSEPYNSISHDSISVQDDFDIFDQLRTGRKKFPNRFLCAYLHINSLRYKDHILTSIKNASSKMLHNFANRYTIRTKFVFSLFLRSLSWYSINRIWLTYVLFSKLAWVHHF